MVNQAWIEIVIHITYMNLNLEQYMDFGAFERSVRMDGQNNNCCKIEWLDCSHQVPTSSIEDSISSLEQLINSIASHASLKNELYYVILMYVVFYS